MRGTPINGIGSVITTGITPACAGNTDVIEVDTGENEDHPRMRGEHYI